MSIEGSKTDQNRVKKLEPEPRCTKVTKGWQSWLGNVALEHPEGLLFIILTITAASVLVLTGTSVRIEKKSNG